ncbi:MAG: T9SS type A sorting domain-containing protein [Saprospiraceae bacterium]
MFSQNLTVNLNSQEPSCNGFTNGVVTASVSGGNGNYSYQWNTGAEGQQVVGSAGTYTVTVTDGNGLTGTANVELGQPSAVVASISSTSSVCTNPGDITTNASGGAGGYTYSWSNGSTSASQTGLAPGNYFVTVTDATGCSTTASTTVFGILDVSLSIINVTCFNGCDASIEAIINGGTAPYAFQWSNGASTQVNPDLLPGTYSVTVTDGNGCQVVETATVANGVTINVDVQTNDASCGDGADGSATFSASGGAEPYTYTLGGGFDADNLTPGTYTVTATDAQGCQGTATFTIGGGSNLTVDVTNDYQCGDATGSATATVSGGSGNYSYAWSNGGSTATVSNLAANASYSVTVTDNGSGCTGTGSTFITGVDNITVNIASMMPSCNGFMNGAATASAVGGDGNYVYNWSTGAATRMIENLGAGSYSVTVSDAQGCGGTASVTIDEPAVLDVTFTANNATCDSPMSGSAIAQPNGGTGPYSYEWTTGATSAMVTGLGAGTYAVTVTDVNGCTVNDMVAITAPASDLSVNVMGTDATCNGEASGSATAQPMNGSGNYTYAWSNGASSATITNVAAGTYSVTISDGDCTASGSVTIGEPSAINVSLQTTNIACTVPGAISASVSGGNAPYDYAWSNGASTANISDLAAGAYTLTVTDASGCMTTASAEVITHGDININILGTDPTCNGGSDGEAMARVVGGSGNYTFEWTNGATTRIVTGLAAGTYSVSVFDGDCMTMASVTISEPEAISVNASVSADGGCTGSVGTVTASASGGTAPYTFTYSNGASGASVELPSGTYTLTATDANGCTATSSVTVSGGGGITVTVETTNTNCAGSSIGTATANGFGGSGTYTYMWNNGATTQTITGLSAGVYRVTVTSSDGCEASGVGAVNNISSTVSVDVTASESVFCPDDATGIAVAAASGGTAPYSYAWSDGQTGDTATDLTAGTYTVTATDADGCDNTASFTIGNRSDLEVEVLVWNPECGNDSNGKIMAMPEGGNEPYTYVWSTGDVTQAILDLSAGTYCVTVTDAAGCTASACADLESAPVPLVDIVIVNPIGAGGNDGSIQAVPVGGTAPYAFNWSNGCNTPVISGLSEGRYGVTITDNNFCQGSAEIVLTGPGGLVGDDINITTNALSSKEVEVSWELSALVSNFAFVVERSDDGGETFQVIGDDATTVENNDMMVYRFVDESPKRGRAYYRVAYVMDADLEYSNTAEAMMSMPDFAMAYPNPVSDEIMVELFSALSTDAQVQLMDTNGRLIKTKKLVSGDMHERMSLEELNPGIYFIRVLRDNDSEPTLIRVIKK